MSDADPSGSTPETAGDVQTDSHAAEAGAGAGVEHEEDSHEGEIVEGGSGAGVPVTKPASVYNKQGGVVEMTQDIVDAVDKFTPPTDFVRKGSRDKSYTYSVGVYVEHTESGSGNHKYYCPANSHCRRTSKVVLCKREDRSNVNPDLKSAHNMQGTAGREGGNEAGKGCQHRCELEDERQLRSRDKQMRG